MSLRECRCEIRGSEFPKPRLLFGRGRFLTSSMSMPMTLPWGPTRAREFAGDVATAAADVQTNHAGPNARTLKEMEGGRPHDSGENAEAVSSFDTAADDVMRLVEVLLVVVAGHGWASSVAGRRRC